MPEAMTGPALKQHEMLTALGDSFLQSLKDRWIKPPLQIELGSNGQAS